MADVRVVVAVLGVLPFAAIGLYAFRESIDRNRDVVWGVVAGVLAFLAIAHAMAELLVGHPALSGTAGEPFALGVLMGGLALGAWGCWVLLLHRVRWRSSFVDRVAWASVLFLGVHSLADGLVLGEAFLPGSPEIAVDAPGLIGTVLHRTAEGALVVVPALAVSWSVGKSVRGLSFGLPVLPGAALAVVLLRLSPASGSFVLELGVRGLVSGFEAGFGLVLLLGGILPHASAAPRARWIPSAIIAFIAIAFVHGLVE